MVQITVKMAVQARDHVYFESLSTSLYALRFQPLGQSKTSFRISASDELRERAKILSIGSKQARISKKQINAIIESPILLPFDLTIMDVLSFNYAVY